MAILLAPNAEAFINLRKFEWHEWHIVSNRYTFITIIHVEEWKNDRLEMIKWAQNQFIAFTVDVVLVADFDYLFN